MPKYQAWIVCRDGKTLEVIGSAMFAQSANRLFVETEIEQVEDNQKARAVKIALFNIAPSLPIISTEIRTVK